MLKIFDILFESKTSVEPDESEGGVLGKYVFGAIRKNIGENIDEPDTELEIKIYNALVFYTSFNSKQQLNNVSAEMKKISDSGKYKKYFSVPSTEAWRVLIGLNKFNLENIIGKKIYQDVGVASNIVISPRSDSNFTGWTLDPKATIRIYSQANFEEALAAKPKSLSSMSQDEYEESLPYLPEYLKEENESAEKYVLLAKCNTDSNSFFFNIDAAMKFLSIGDSPYNYQKEILAYGDVVASKVAYKKIESSSKNPIPELLDLLK